MLKKLFWGLILIVLLAVGGAYYAYKAILPDIIARGIADELFQAGYHKVRVVPPLLSLSQVTFPEIITDDFAIENLEFHLDLLQTWNFIQNYQKNSDLLHKLFAGEIETFPSTPLSKAKFKQLRFHHNSQSYELNGEVKFLQKSISFFGDIDTPYGEAKDTVISLNPRYHLKLEEEHTIALNEDIGHLKVNADFDLLNGNGNFSYYTKAIDTLSFLTLLKGHEVELPSDVEINGGKITISGRGKITRKTFNHQHWITLQEIEGIYQKINFSGGYGTIPLEIVDTNVLTKPFEFLIRKLTYGLDANNTSGLISLQWKSPESYSINLRNLSSEILESSITSKSFTISTKRKQYKIPIEVKGLALDKLLELYPDSPIKASGTINMSLPLMVSDTIVTISNGKVTSIPPGGFIQYQQDSSLPKAQNSAAYAIAALENFDYKKLSAEVSLQSNGELLIKTSLSGSSKILNNRRPVNVNLNVEQNLFDLLKSLTLVSNLPDKIIKEK